MDPFEYRADLTGSFHIRAPSTPNPRADEKSAGIVEITNSVSRDVRELVWIDKSSRIFNDKGFIGQEQLHGLVINNQVHAAWRECAPPHPLTNSQFSSRVQCLNLRFAWWAVGVLLSASEFYPSLKGHGVVFPVW